MSFNEETLQEIGNYVSELAGEKAHYTFLIRQRGRSCADTYHYHKTGRRVIKISPSYIQALNKVPDGDLYYFKELIRTILHEIAHFKECERGRRKANKLKQQYGTPNYSFLSTYGYHRHKWHTNHFDRAYDKLLANFETNFGETINNKKAST